MAIVIDDEGGTSNSLISSWNHWFSQNASGRKKALQRTLLGLGVAALSKNWIGG